MKLPFQQTFSWKPVIALAALLVVLVASPAQAVTRDWVAPAGGNWTNAANWNPAGEPQLGDVVEVTTTNTQTVSYNTNNNFLFDSLLVNATGGGTVTLTQSSKKLSTGDETVGSDGKGIHTQNSGSTTINDLLLLGQAGAGVGTYNKNSGSLSAGSMIVGQNGTGTYNHSSGTTSIANDLILGENASGKGTVNISSGTFTVGGNEIVGQNGLGTLKQSSGSHTIGGGLFVGNNSGSSGSSYTMSSGSLTIDDVLYVGSENSTATFSQSSGSVKVLGLAAPPPFGSFNLGRQAGTKGTYTQSSGSVEVTGEGFIGQAGEGIYNQTSGSVKFTGPLTLAEAAGSKGTYNMNSGSLTAPTIQINGSTTPAPTGTGEFYVKGTATINGDVTNDGKVKTGPGATVTWNGDFVNNSQYISDPSTQTFNNDLKVTKFGYIEALANQDQFIIKGDFINESALNVSWDTDNARLRFAKGGDGNDNDHIFDIAGGDNGKIPIGDNFGWRLLNITNQDITLRDPNGGTAALYVKILTGADVSVGPNVVNNIFGDPFDVVNIYYDETLAANAYLANLTYDFAGGLGQLIPNHSVAAAAQPLAAASSATFATSNAPAANGYVDAAPVANGYFYGLLYNMAYSGPVALTDYPFKGWKTYDF